MSASKSASIRTLSSSSTANEAIVKASDEATPLLAAVASGPNAEPVETSTQADNGIYADDEDAPLPKIQIFLLSYARVVEPIAFFSIFPYINQMIEDTGIETRNVPFYSGLIESLFSATQMLVMLWWGRAADRLGRKPVLVFSLFGVTFATALFGMSTTVWQMVLFRCIAGVFAGSLVTIRAMITENSTKKTQARAFSYFAFAGNMGICVGPLVGGALESPGKKFPSTFGRIQFFNDYPYAFPGFVSSLFGLSGAILTILFVKETLHIHQSNKGKRRPMSTWELINAPGVKEVLLIYNYICLLAFAYTSVNNVFLYMPVDMGGTGFPPSLIAAFIAIAGASQAFWILGVFPPLQRRSGTGAVFRACALAWPCFFAMYPISNLLLRYDFKVAFWILSPTGLVVGSGVAMAFIASQIAVNDIAPSPESLGELNAIVLSLSCGLRAVVPALATALYGLGINSQILDGHLYWILMIALGIGLNFVLRLLPEKAEGRYHSRENEA